ncbi:methyltransferase [Nocardiopsis nanhaiensis]
MTPPVKTTGAAQPRAEEGDEIDVMRSMLYGQLLTQALYACCEAGVVDHLAIRPLTAEELARECEVHEKSLYRLLRALRAFDILKESADGRFTLTSLGETLAPGSPASLRSTALLVGRAVGPAWGALAHTVRTGDPAYPHVHGQGFFEHLGTDPDLRTVFDASQERDVEREFQAVHAALAGSLTGTVVDVGGGDGALLAHLLDAEPELSGLLVDLPSAVVAAERRLSDRGLEGRASVVRGDFFEPLPGGDLYVLREILHDWDDTSCLRILTNCRRSMGTGSRLAVAELIYEQDGGEESRLPALMDLYMMSLFSGAERRIDEFLTLIAEAGLTVERVHPLGGGKGLLLCRPTEPRS